MITFKRPIFREDWPGVAGRFAKFMRREQPRDKGIGDTIFRMFGQRGIDVAVTELREKNRLACATCANKRMWMNRIFPFYAPSKADNQGRLASFAGRGSGKSLVIVANGPSHAEAGLERLAGKVDTMMVNRPFAPIWPATYWVFVDPSVANQNRLTWAQYPGTCFYGSGVKMYNSDSILISASHHFQADVLNKGAMVRPSGKKGGRQWYGTTTLVAMQLAMYMNYAEVFVFGVDMSAGADGKLYPWGSNPACPDVERIRRFPDENQCFELAANALGEDARRFTFCSSYLRKAGWSFLSRFAAMDHETAVERILERVG